VGAKDNFIKIPFYAEGMIQGTAGGIIGLFILFIAFVFVSSNIDAGFSSSYFSIKFLPFDLIALIVLSSTFVGWLGSFLSLRQFFKI
jgi:cell division transport system permease protein